ncbi:MAG: hypothetical protein KF773_30705 [Deltaproteobacteria bacterium]|nr:hypothetical protein [Deltaproteobacteria bacterium]
MNPVIFVRQFADVVRRLHEQGVADNDPQLRIKFHNAWHLVLGGSVAQRAAQLRVDLPSLEDKAQADILADNVSALGALYFAAQLEDLKFFAVADKVTEQFLSGLIPVSRSEGGGAIYKYYRDAEDRFTEVERRSMYARAFGFAQGAVEEPLPNREFGDLWIRFCSATSIYQREVAVTGQRRKITEEELFKNARDLAVNLSLHGYGIAHFAAIELQDTIKGLLKTLSYPDVLQAYGVLDVWQLVERVSGLYLGGAVNSVRQRALATAGSQIILWLAEKSKHLSGIGGTLGLEPGLIKNIDRWLAITGTGEDQTDRYSDPVSISAQPTIPEMGLRAAPDLFHDAMNLVNGANGIGAVAKN